MVNWDKLGNLVSLLCLLHCIALPWLAVVLPLSFLLDESVHVWLFIALLPAAVFGAWSGWRHHGDGKPSLLLAAGLALVGAAAFIPMNTATEVALTIPGSLLLIAGHTLNRRLKLISHIASASTATP
ncbi:MerC domain-containing protein [Methylobacillus arboreus]|uniref:MerC domain-containing protein n=1 Tax=Methylobacillus arboreus TaxID=755170 RepID=UPI001E3CA2E0|nr:MerC domain-containing protein [Methylobacillus arboreus]MCB5190812.1 MerC domain-containing protein [Methylobacillus arboreus]